MMRRLLRLWRRMRRLAGQSRIRLSEADAKKIWAEEDARGQRNFRSDRFLR